MKNFISLFLCFCLTITFLGCESDKKLPIYGQREAKVTTSADGSTKVDTVYQTIPQFSFLSQDSIPLTQDAFKDKIYIADFFFTSCSTICPVMHRNLKEVYDQYLDNPEVMYLSHTIDFKYDKPSVLKSYAKKLGVDDKKWQFVWGPKDDIYKLAQESYLTVVEEDDSSPDGYIHQGWLVLIDKEKRMRGAYDGTDKEQVEKLKKDVTTLLNEYKK
ncbi:MAG: SCO family protein [Pedobacter sp.]|nr:MAG: SCO family protein [Pedobacter sp.]